MSFENAAEKINRKAPQALWKQVESVLLEEIIAQKMNPGERLPGMMTLAENFGVSAITIDLALKSLIQKGFCERLPKKGTIVRNNTAYSMEIKQGTIIVYSNFSSYEYDFAVHPYHKAIHAAAEKYHAANLLSFSGPSGLDMIEEYLSRKDNDVLGVIFLVVPDLSPVLKIARKFPFHNFVQLNLNYPDFDDLMPSNVRGIFNDEFAGGYMAATYLIAQGCKRPGVIYYTCRDINYLLRIQGFYQAFEDSGITLLEKIEHFSHSESPMENGADAVTDFFSREHLPDSLFCVNDILAAGAAKELSHKGFRDGMLIIGYDNLLPELHESNKFATISINTTAMSTAAVRMLFEPKAYPVRKLLIEPKLRLSQNPGQLE